MKPTVDLLTVQHHVRVALGRGTRADVWTSVADVPVLLAEIERLTSLVAWHRTEYANLLAAARATIAADRDGEPDPLSYLRDEIAHQDYARSTR